MTHPYKPIAAHCPISCARGLKGFQQGEYLKGSTRLHEDTPTGDYGLCPRGGRPWVRIASRDDVAAYLEKEGLTITRATQSALTVLVTGTLEFFAGSTPQEAQKHAVIRLKGGDYTLATILRPRGILSGLSGMRSLNRDAKRRF